MQDSLASCVSPVKQGTAKTLALLRGLTSKGIQLIGKRHSFVLLGILAYCLVMLVTACQPAPDKVCLVLDTGIENDASFNEYTLKGAREAAIEAGVAFAHLPSFSEADYVSNIEGFVSEGCDLIITVGFLMGEATAMAAREHPNVSFVIVDVAYTPGDGCAEDVADCYSKEGGLTNVTSLMFAEDEAGYLAGTLAGCMSETAVIGSVAGMEIPPVVRFVTGYQNGARSQNPDIETLNIYMTDFHDPAGGKRVAETQIRQDADIVFGVGGNTGNAALLAAHEAGRLAIGVDVDQYYTFPDVAPSLLTSAMKNVDMAAYDAVMAFIGGDLESGIRFSTVENDGIGLAPYHDLAGRVPEACQEAVEAARRGLAEGTLSTGVGP